MNIISIDVGMRHLAYCILSVDKDNYTVEKWDIIDLCDKNVHPCCAFDKHGDPCKKSTKYYKDNNYYCVLHAKKQPIPIPLPEMQVSKIKKMKMTDIKRLASTLHYNISKQSKKQDYIDHIILDLSNNYLQPIIKTNSKSIDFVTYGKRIQSSFNKILSDIKVDCMIIENQIGPLALRMKVIQGMIMQHFIEVGCPTIKEISPSNKLKEFSDKKKTSYAERKTMGITITKQFLKNNNNITKWREYFEKHKKKDDLADSFLQGIWYIKTIVMRLT